MAKLTTIAETQEWTPAAHLILPGWQDSSAADLKIKLLLQLDDFKCSWEPIAADSAAGDFDFTSNDVEESLGRLITGR